MEWHKLELTKASVIKKEVDAVINLLTEAVANDASNKSSIISAIQARIQELENFYIRNNDGSLYYCLIAASHNFYCR